VSVTFGRSFLEDVFFLWNSGSLILRKADLEQAYTLRVRARASIRPLGYEGEKGWDERALSYWKALPGELRPLKPFSREAQQLVLQILVENWPGYQGFLPKYAGFLKRLSPPLDLGTDEVRRDLLSGFFILAHEGQKGAIGTDIDDRTVQVRMRVSGSEEWPQCKVKR
jgi:hypothetical protein